jgi:hypothetical protein
MWIDCVPWSVWGKRSFFVESQMDFLLSHCVKSCFKLESKALLCLPYARHYSISETWHGLMYKFIFCHTLSANLKMSHFLNFLLRILICTCCFEKWAASRTHSLCGTSHCQDRSRLSAAQKEAICSPNNTRSSRYSRVRQCVRVRLIRETIWHHAGWPVASRPSIEPNKKCEILGFVANDISLVIGATINTFGREGGATRAVAKKTAPALICEMTISSRNVFSTRKTNNDASRGL